MAFKPLGFAFDFRSPLPPEAVRAAVRQRGRNWFDRVDGPRGWMLGRFVCLWVTARSATGPLLIGLVEEEGAGTRLRGLAGSDLNGTVCVAVVVAVACLALLRSILVGEVLDASVYVMFGFILIMFLAGLYLAHARSRDAMVLLDFLKDAAQAQDGRDVPITRQIVS